MIAFPKFLLVQFLFLWCQGTLTAVSSNQVKTFLKQNVDMDSWKTFSKRQTANSCGTLNKFEEKLDSSQNKHVFRNDSNLALAVTWSGTDGVILVVTTVNGFFLTQASKLYRSVNRGKSFIDISHFINGDVITRDAGMQVNPTDSTHVILVGYNWYFKSSSTTNIYVTTDAGKTFTKAVLPFLISQTFKFSPLSKKSVLILSPQHVLFMSTNSGITWSQISTGVFSSSWDPINPNVLYYTTSESLSHGSGSESNADKDMFRYDITTGEAMLLATHVRGFAAEQNFLLLSIQFYGKNGTHVLHVSKDEGRTWNAAQLPLVDNHGFYFFLDMTEDMAFIHVDNPGDSGHGSIYTSDERGIVYSFSLERHLFPERKGVTDFYKVKSLSGVYITSQLGDDNSVHSRITFDKGGTWHPIAPPAGSLCHESVKNCHLHLHNLFSMTKRVKFSSLPLSSNNTVGLILAHGNLGDALTSEPPSVFVSIDGGYSWNQPRQLEGPQFYEIGDSGGILYAISSLQTEIDTIMFSVDEGQCWHAYKFVDDKIIVTGMSTEPGQKATDITIWGWGVNGDSSWMVITLNFEKVLGKLCGDSDYTTWLAHADNMESSDIGCVLGAKKHFVRRKKGSVCENRDQLEGAQHTEHCKCQKTDYLCDFGYRRNEQNDCIEDHSKGYFNKDICINQFDEMISTKGYRRIPGDVCKGGFEPKRKVINLHKNCPNAQAKLDDYGINTPSSSGGLVAFIVISCLFLMSFLGFLFYKKRHKLLKSEYSELPSSSNDDGPKEEYGFHNEPDENVLVDVSPLTPIHYHDDSDEDKYQLDGVSVGMSVNEGGRLDCIRFSVGSYQRFIKKWYSQLPCLAPSIVD